MYGESYLFFYICYLHKVWHKYLYMVSHKFFTQLRFASKLHQLIQWLSILFCRVLNTWNIHCTLDYKSFFLPWRWKNLGGNLYLILDRNHTLIHLSLQFFNEPLGGGSTSLYGDDVAAWSLVFSEHKFTMLAYASGDGACPGFHCWHIKLGSRNLRIECHLFLL